jgi:hypothetical protein
MNKRIVNVKVSDFSSASQSLIQYGLSAVTSVQRVSAEVILNFDCRKSKLSGLRMRSSDSLDNLKYVAGVWRDYAVPRHLRRVFRYDWM